MTIRKILKYPDPQLAQVSSAVTSFDRNLQHLVDDMFETMYAAEGIGLAAPQIGVLQRVVTIDLGDEGEPLTLINPEIIHTEGTIDSEEGCLSIPGFRDNIMRRGRVIVNAYTLKGEHFQIEAQELLSRCLQHEIDHLDGVLFIDRLSRLKRQFFNRWLKKRGPFE
jgi:peptide deformylase